MMTHENVHFKLFGRLCLEPRSSKRIETLQTALLFSSITRVDAIFCCVHAKHFSSSACLLLVLGEVPRRWSEKSFFPSEWSTLKCSTVQKSAG